MLWTGVRAETDSRPSYVSLFNGLVFLDSENILPAN